MHYFHPYCLNLADCAKAKRYLVAIHKSAEVITIWQTHLLRANCHDPVGTFRPQGLSIIRALETLFLTFTPVMECYSTPRKWNKQIRNRSKVYILDELSPFNWLIRPLFTMGHSSDELWVKVLYFLKPYKHRTICFVCIIQRFYILFKVDFINLVKPYHVSWLQNQNILSDMCDNETESLKVELSWKSNFKNSCYNYTCLFYRVKLLNHSKR